MAAGVHPSRVFRRIGDTRRLGKRESVDVGAKRDVLPGAASAAQKRDRVSSEKRIKQLHAEPGKPLPNQCGSLELLSGELRNPVQRVAEFDDSRQDFLDGFHASR